MTSAADLILLAFEFFEDAVNLHGKFAGGNQHEGLNALGLAFPHQLDGGDKECQGLAGSGLRGREYIASFECRRNSLGLNGGWDDEFCCLKPLLKSRGKGISVNVFISHSNRCLLSVLPSRDTH